MHRTCSLPIGLPSPVLAVIIIKKITQPMPNAKEIKIMFEEYLKSNSLELTVEVKTKNLIFKKENKTLNNYLVYSFDNRGGCLYLDNSFSSWVEIKTVEDEFRKVHKSRDIKQYIYHTIQSGRLFANFEEHDLSFKGVSVISNELKVSIKTGMLFWDQYNSVQKIRDKVKQLKEENEVGEFLRMPSKLRKLAILAITNDLEYDDYRNYVENWYSERFIGPYAAQLEDIKSYLPELLNNLEKLKMMRI